MHFYAWEKGLKTGMYYLRTKPATNAIKFTIDKQYETSPEALVTTTSTTIVDNTTTVVDSDEAMNQISCSLDNPEDCLSCGS